METTVKILTKEELEACLDDIRSSPRDHGTLEMIVRRPGEDKREELKEGALDPGEGLVGDNWQSRGSSMTSDGSAHPDMQINIMNSRTISHIAVERDRWKLAGDQLFVDLDLGKENLPTGSRLQIGTAVVEVTGIPHLGCKKFTRRFGLPAMQFVNSKTGKALNLRGINAKVVKGGIIRAGDGVIKL